MPIYKVRAIDDPDDHYDVVQAQDSFQMRQTLSRVFPQGFSMSLIEPEVLTYYAQRRQQQQTQGDGRRT